MSHFEPLPDEHTLTLGQVFARVSAHGASLTSLEVLGETVIDHVSAQAARFAFAGATLAPWPNRLRDGAYSFEGRDFSFDQLDSMNNLNHGLVFNRTFEMSELTASAVTFATTLGGHEGYPFKVNIEVCYELTESGLIGEIRATNLGDKTAPVAFGSHPYLAVDDDCQIDIKASTEAVADERMIPVGWRPAQKHRASNGLPLSFKDLQIDDCFTDLDRDADNLASVVITRASGDQIKVWQDQTFKYLMVYAHHNMAAFGMKINGLALEPQTAPANAMQSGSDLFMLKPTETKSAQWGIEFAKAK